MHVIDIGPRPGQSLALAAPAIEVVGLERRYGDFHAVRGISFEVHAGEVFALLGVNGAGKTSALEILEGLAAPSGGIVRILGHDPRRDRAAVRRHLGVLLQHSGLPGDLTVRETVQTWARTLTDPRSVAEALEQVVLAGRADIRVRSLSGGERRRLDLALALLGRPRLVVLDEPTTGLDPESRRAVWGIVRNWLAAEPPSSSPLTILRRPRNSRTGSRSCRPGWWCSPARRRRSPPPSRRPSGSPCPRAPRRCHGSPACGSSTRRPRSS